MTTTKPELSDEEEYQYWYHACISPYSNPCVEDEMCLAFSAGLKRGREKEREAIIDYMAPNSEAFVEFINLREQAAWDAGREIAWIDPFEWKYSTIEEWRKEGDKK